MATKRGYGKKAGKKGYKKSSKKAGKSKKEALSIPFPPILACLRKCHADFIACLRANPTKYKECFARYQVCVRKCLKL